MTLKQKLLHTIQNTLSRSRLITLLIVKIRNQCNRIIIQRLAANSTTPHENGEYLVLDHIVPACTQIFDVGANKGEWTAHILNYPISFYLYEPGKAAFKLCKQRFEQYSNVLINNQALSDSIGKIDFYEEDNAGEMSSVINQWADGAATLIEVNTTTIDAELHRLKIDKLSFVKIDTEGFDLKVLKGATQAITQQKIGFIQFEYNQSWAFLGATLAEAQHLLHQNGYTLFLIRPKGLYYYDVNQYGEFFAFSNFMAIAPQNIPQVQSIIRGNA